MQDSTPGKTLITTLERVAARTAAAAGPRIDRVGRCGVKVAAAADDKQACKFCLRVDELKRKLKNAKDTNRGKKFTVTIVCFSSSRHHTQPPQEGSDFNDAIGCNGNVA